MKLKKIRVFHVVMKLKEYFETSFGGMLDRHCVIVAVEDENGIIGWGEAPVDNGPWYSYETVETTMYVYNEFIIPLLRKNPEIEKPWEFFDRVKRVRGYRMAKAGIEFALWDLYAKQLGIPLYKAIGGVRKIVGSGISIGVIGDMDRLLKLVEKYLERGYRRVKIKIAPGWDIVPVKTIRKEFGEISLQVDANAAYTLKDLKVFEELDKYDLLMIEQPLSYEDLYEHSILQSKIKTPICLDESIKNIHDAQAGHKLGSYKIINVKPARVGGLTETIKINDFALKNNIPIWIGGMLETGIGRAFQVASATLPAVKYPNDISESSRYYEEEIVDPPWTINKGYIRVPEEPGIGVEVLEEVLKKYVIRQKEYVFH